MKTYDFGVELRDFLLGVLGGRRDMAPPVTERPESDDGAERSESLKPELFDWAIQAAERRAPVIAWGPRVDVTRLRPLYGPQKIERFRATPGGIDNLALSSTDIFEVPGMGEFTVRFKGYFQVARDNPTTKEWATSNVFVNMTDLKLRGESDELGTMAVTLNPRILSAGQVFASGAPDAAAACRIATGAMFSLPKLGVTGFNKEPILLMNDAIESVPPLEDPNGKAHLYRLPLYDTKNPNGQPIAYLKSLRYTVGNYITREEARAIHASVVEYV